MARSASILHADLDAFFASVEQRDDPALRGRPVIVGGGVVLAASYEARARGVRSAMGGGRARRLCPAAIVVPPRFAAYVEASRAVFAILERMAPRVERASIDEAYLDLGPGVEVQRAREVAVALRRAVRDEAGLPISVGVAPSKVVAKIAGGQAKPDGLVVVAPDEELAFLHPLGVGVVPGVGPATVQRLHRHGLGTVGDLARVGEEVLVAVLGRAGGRRLHAIAHGLDARPVRTSRRRRSYGAQRALGRAGKSSAEVDAALVGLVERLVRRMEPRGDTGRTVVLRLRFGDYARATRSRTLPRGTADAAAITVVARSLLAQAAPAIERRGLTLIGVALTGLEREEWEQLTLPLGLICDTGVGSNTSHPTPGSSPNLPRP